MAVVEVDFPGNISQVDTATDLRALPSAFIENGAIYIVSAIGVFAYDSASLATDDGITVIKPNDKTPLQAGRWEISGDDAFASASDFAALVPQVSLATQFQQAGSGAILRPVREKLRETEFSVADFSDGTDWGAATDLAVAAIGNTTPARLVTPKRAWSTTSRDYSNYRNITFVFQPGALIANGGATVTLPERVEIGLGAGFTGAGLVIQKNKDETPLQEPGGGHVRTGNVARGIGVLAKNIGGYSNFGEGYGALASAQYTRGNIALGAGVLSKVVGDQTGARATISGGEIISYNARGDANIGIGNTALRDMTTGVENLALGDNTMQQLVTGLCNVAVGAQSQITNTDGNFNVSVGAYALVVNKGSNNLALGWAALEGQTMGSNVAIGHAVMNGNKTGTSNVAIGILALQTAQIPSESVVVGQEAGKNLVGLVGGVLIGAFAGGSSAAAALTNVTFVGRNAGLICTADECTGIGAGALSANTTYGNCAGLGTNAQVTGVNQVQLGDARTTVFAYGAVQNRSDARDKTDVRDTTLGLDFINALRPVDYRWDFRDDYANWTPDGSMKRVRYHHGLIAQDVDALRETFGDFGGLQHHQVNGGKDVFSLGYEELIAPLIKAVQQLSARVAELESK